MVSSASNALVPISASRWLSPDELGVVVLVYGAIQVCSQILKSWLGDSLLLAGDRSKDPFPYIVRAVFIASLLVSFALLTITFGNNLKSTLYLSFAISSVLASEMVRLSFLYTASGSRLLSFDASWLVLQCVAMAVVISSSGDDLSGALIIAAWGFAAAASCFGWWRTELFARQTAIHKPKLPSSSRYLLLDGVLVSVAPYLLILTVASAGSISIAGEYQAATILALPIVVIQASLSTVLIANSSDQSFSRRVLALSTAVLISAVWILTAIVSVASDNLGETLLGQAWPPAKEYSTIVALVVTTGILFRASILANKMTAGVTVAVRSRVVYSAILAISAAILRPNTVRQALAVVGSAQLIALCAGLTMTAIKFKRSDRVAATSADTMTK